MRRSRAIRLTLGLILLCAAFAVRAETPSIEVAASPRLLIKGSISSADANRIARRLEKLASSNVETVLIELDEASGSPLAALVLAARIRDSKEMRTIACVNGSNVGAATVVALACDELRLTSTGLIGAVDCGDDAGDRARVIAALKQGRDEWVRPALEAMVLPGMEIHLIENTDGSIRLMERRELEFRKLPSGVPLVREEALLTLDAATAVRLKLAGPTVASADVLAAELGIVAAARPLSETPDRETGGEWSPPQCEKAAILFLKGPIGAALEAQIRRRIEKVKEDGSFDLLVIQTDSPGGTVYHSELIGDLVFETGDEMHTVAWVPRDAISGACLTSYAAKDIVMGPAGTIGDCQPIIITSEGYEALGEKAQSPLRATFRKYAQRNGYSAAIAESMVTQEIGVLRVTDDDGRRHYFKKQDWDELDPGRQAAYSEPEVVVEAGKLPTFTASEAEYNDLSRAVVASRKELLALYGVEPSNAVEFPVTWSEDISAFLLEWKGLLFFIGLIALYLEFKAPGFGVAGFVGIVAFTLFFAAGSIGGVAESLEIVLFIAGLGLIALELFVFPGFGLPGISGLVLIIASLYMASSPFVVPNTPLAQGFLFNWMLHFGSAFVGAVVFAVVAARFLPSIPMFNRIMLSPPGDAAALTATGTGLEKTVRALVGASGTALTDLRPAGRAKIEGRRLDVVTQGSFIERGSTIVVTKVRGNLIVVRPGPSSKAKT